MWELAEIVCGRKSWKNERSVDGRNWQARRIEGSELAPELLVDPSVRLDPDLLLAGGIQEIGGLEMAMYKPRWGAFFKTPLEGHLREHGISTLVFCGCNFPNCPRTSIYEASERDFRVVLPTDAISGLYERGEEELAAIGVQLMTSDQIATGLLDRLARTH